MSIENAILNRTLRQRHVLGTQRHLRGATKKLEDWCLHRGQSLTLKQPVAGVVPGLDVERYHDIYQRRQRGPQGELLLQYVPLSGTRWATSRERACLDRAVLKAAKEQGLINE